MALATNTQVKAHLSITSSTYDTLLTTLISQVAAMIAREFGVRATASDGSYDTITDEYRDSDGSMIVTTKYCPIRTLTALKYKQSDNTFLDYSGELIGDVVFNEATNEIYPLYQVAPRGRRNLKISYTCGYKSSEVPADLNLAVILLVAQLFNQRDSVGLTSQSVLGLAKTLDPKDALYVTKVFTAYKPVIVE